MGIDSMKWEEDLVKDIRFNDYRDDLDWPFVDKRFCFEETGLPMLPSRSRDLEDFSVHNQMSLLPRFLSIKENCRCIVEIGVSRSKRFNNTSTSIFLNNKRDDTHYLGIDIEDKTYLNNIDLNINTIQTRSEHIDVVMEKLNSMGVDRIDFLFIDGWHSINQVLAEWEYTKLLSDTGVVGFHDTAYHPGPHFFINNLNQDKWNVMSNACADIINDYGIGFAWKKI
jgi:predicted O-methyltransferase YrrM